MEVVRHSTNRLGKPLRKAGSTMQSSMSPAEGACTHRKAGFIMRGAHRQERPRAQEGGVPKYAAQRTSGAPKSDAPLRLCVPATMGATGYGAHRAYAAGSAANPTVQVRAEAWAEVWAEVQTSLHAAVAVQQGLADASCGRGGPSGHPKGEARWPGGQQHAPWPPLLSYDKRCEAARSPATRPLAVPLARSGMRHTAHARSLRTHAQPCKSTRTALRCRSSLRAAMLTHAPAHEAQCARMEPMEPRCAQTRALTPASRLGLCAAMPPHAPAHEAQCARMEPRCTQARAHGADGAALHTDARAHLQAT